MFFEAALWSSFLPLLIWLEEITVHSGTQDVSAQPYSWQIHKLNEKYIMHQYTYNATYVAKLGYRHN